jgi:hypothetical protein
MQFFTYKTTTTVQNIVLIVTSLKNYNTGLHLFSRQMKNKLLVEIYHNNKNILAKYINALYFS